MGKDIAITVERLGKKYKIGRKLRNDTLRDTIMQGISGLFDRPERQVRPDVKSFPSDEFWALRDVSFEVNTGEIVGIIGRNGAGKSTLLKTLARITEPTSGRIDIYGHVGSLLEVGTGFHQELTGRENLFLSGSILGMKRSEIIRHFDEIVDFAEVEEFIDTPVKRYSSGMYLRLAFGVAAFLQPEILLIDEVLAVGDAAFQRKCLGKMDDVAKQGRTVLFVSHNMSAIHDLCGRSIMIDAGQVKFDGNTTQCIAEYLKTNSPDNLVNAAERQGNEAIEIIGFGIGGSGLPSIEMGQEFDITLNLQGSDIRNPAVILIIENVAGQQIVHSRVTTRELGLETLNGQYRIDISLPGLWLTPGVYSVYFKLLVPTATKSGRLQSERLMLEVRGDFDNTGRTLLCPKTEWGISQLLARN